MTSLNFVDLAIIGKEGTLYETVEYVKPNVIALGYDQAHSEKDIAENCQKRNLNVQVIRLSTPLPGSKSSKIKEEWEIQSMASKQARTCTFILSPFLT